MDESFINLEEATAEQKVFSHVVGEIGETGKEIRFHVCYIGCDSVGFPGINKEA